MLELLWQLAIFFLGMSIGKFRASNTDITDRTSYMQELLNQAYSERDKYRMSAISSEQEIESWKRRYDNLYKANKLEKEDQVGSTGSRNGS